MPNCRAAQTLVSKSKATTANFRVRMINPFFLNGEDAGFVSRQNDALRLARQDVLSARRSAFPVPWYVAPLRAGLIPMIRDPVSAAALGNPSP
jgi:hypothetical protein